MATKAVFDFSGGMNVSNTPLTLADNEAELILNYQLNRYGGLRKRGGLRDLSGQEAGDYRVMAISTGNHRDGTTFIHSKIGTVYEYAGTIWDSRLTSFGTTYPMACDALAERIYIGSYGDELKSSTTGTTWDFTSTPGDPANFKPMFLKTFQNRMYAARTNAFETRLYFSEEPAPAWTVAWDVTNDWVLVDDKSDESAAIRPITGLNVNGDRLLVFFDDKMFRFDQQAGLSRVADVGAFYNTLIHTNRKYGTTFFVGQDGIFAYSPYEGRPRSIDAKIRRLLFDSNLIRDNWVDESNGIYGCMTSDEENVYIRPSSDITIDGRTFTNPVLVYNIPLDAWTMYTMSKNISCFADVSQDLGSDADSTATAWWGTSKPLDTRNYEAETFCGTADGYIMQFGAPNSTDNGTIIETELISKEYLLGFPKVVALDEINLASIQNGKTQVFFDTDRKGSFTPLGELGGRFTSFPTRNAPKCNSIRVKLTSSDEGVLDGRSIIEGFTLDYTEYPYNHENKRG